MIQELTGRLAAAKENGRLQEVWTQRLGTLEQELEALNHTARLWEKQLRKEEKDVEKLKGRSFTSFLYDLLDKKQS